MGSRFSQTGSFSHFLLEVFVCGFLLWFGGAFGGIFGWVFFVVVWGFFVVFFIVVVGFFGFYYGETSNTISECKYQDGLQKGLS